MIMSFFTLLRQKISLKFIVFWKNYEQCKYHFFGFHGQNIFQSFELAVQNKKFQKQTVFRLLYGYDLESSTNGAVLLIQNF